VKRLVVGLFVFVCGLFLLVFSEEEEGAVEAADQAADRADRPANPNQDQNRNRKQNRPNRPSLQRALKKPDRFFHAQEVNE
jgi:hypothetical protein